MGGDLPKKVLVFVVLVLFVGAGAVLGHLGRTVDADGVDDGLVACWHFDEGSGSIAYDSSGNNNDATIHGATWTTGISNGALDFDGSNDYVEVPPIPQITDITMNQITFEGWIYLRNVSGGQSGLNNIWEGHVSTTSPPYYSEIFIETISNSSRLQFCIPDTDGVAHRLNTPDNLSLNNWHYIAGTYDGSEQRIYVDGVVVNASSWVNTFTITTGFMLGRDYEWAAQYLDGLLDEVSIYSYALTADEILAHYQQYNPAPSTVYVDDNYDSSTPGWGYDHFDSIQDGINAVAEGGTVYVFNGTYYEGIDVTKSRINLIGEDKNSTIIDGTGLGPYIDVVDINRDNVTFSGFTVQGGLNHCIDINRDYIIVTNNIAKNSNKAIIEVNRNYSIISGNIVYNSNSPGIEIRNGIGGIHHNIISNNTVENCSCGIAIGEFHDYDPCTDNIISHNTFRANQIGIHINGSNNNNHIYHNNFINNIQNAYDECINIWDNGYPSGGNYWSDFDEPSEGAYDNNSDGIVDSPYYIPGGGNVDRYPLIHPWNWAAPIPSIVYVDDDFNSSTPGWNYDHFDKIQEGINAVAENGTVYVFNGEYCKSVRIAKPLNLVGENNKDTILNITDYSNTIFTDCIAVRADYVHISNIHITNGDTAAIAFRSPENPNNCEIKNCIITGNNIGIYIPHGGTYNIVSNCIIEKSRHAAIDVRNQNNCVIKNCIISNSTGYQFPHGIVISGSFNVTIVNCTIYNVSHGIHIESLAWSSASGWAIIENVSINNCNIYNNNLGIFLKRCFNSTIINSLIKFNQVGIYATDNTSNNLIYNNYFSNTHNAYDNGNNIWNISKILGTNIIGGPYLGGNYWSDFDEPSEGAYDNNSDGIVDSPYYIPGGGNLDRYPLIRPYTGYYYDNFEDGTLNKWYIISGEWEVITEPSGNHIAHLNRSSDWCRILVSKEEIPENAIIQAKVKGNCYGGDPAADTSIGFYANRNGSGFYWLMLGGGFTSGNKLYLGKRVNDTEYGLVENISVTTNNNIWYNVKIRLECSNIFAKIWQVGHSEPLHWQISYMNATKFGNYIIIGAEAGQNDEEFWFDNISVKTIPSTVYVDNDFNSSTPGWNYDHFDGIQDGIDAVAENGTVYVFNGTYYENVVINKSINLVGENRERTIIDAKGNGSFHHNAVIWINWTDWVSIDGFTVTNASTGIAAANSTTQVKIRDCIVKDCSDGWAGILIHYNPYSTIENCFSYNNSGYGILSYLGRHSSIKNCTVFNNGNGIGLVGTTFSNVTNCTIFNNKGIGINLATTDEDDVSNITIMGCNILNNSYGIKSEDTGACAHVYNNLIYHNNFINNIQNAYDKGDNTWENGYPSGGNYWDDYTGVDYYSGPNQDIPGGDGIGDTPYYIPGGNNVDRYPFMKPNGWLDTTPPVTTKIIGDPKYGSNDEWVTSHTEFNLTAIDNVSGVDATYYRIWYNYSWTPWIEYTGNFTLSGEGKHYLEYYSVDNAGNIEEVHNQTHYVDDTPPTTSKKYGEPYYRDKKREWITSYTPIYLNTIDNPTCSPSGVNNTYYKIDDGEWKTYTRPFFIPEECQHIIYFYSNDHLGNTEKMKNQTVYVDNTPPVSNITISEPKFNWTEFLLEQLIRYIPPEIRDIYNSLPIFVTNHSHIRPQAQDQGQCPVGVGAVYYRTWNTFDGWTEWQKYEEKQKPIDIAKPGFCLEKQGPNYIEYYSQDLLRNKEKTVHNLSCIVDDTPPTTEAFGYNPIILKTTEHGGKHASKNPMENALKEFPPVGLFYIHYRYKIGENGEWTNWFTSELQYFTGYVTITHNSILDPIYVDYYAVDILGNMEEMHRDIFTP